MPKLSAAGKKILDEYIAELDRDGKLPGFAVAVTNADEQIYAAAGGRYNYEDPASRKADVDQSVFWQCSSTKLIASLAALKLIEQGKLSLSDPVSKFFPVFNDCVVLQDAFTDPSPKFAKATKQVTIDHLFTHTSGLYYALAPNKKGEEHILGLSYTQDYEDNEEKYDKFWNAVKGEYPGIPLVFEPGSAWFYGISSDVLGFVVEKVSGQSLEDFSQENFFKPLGIKTSYRLNAETAKDLIPLHYRYDDGSIKQWNDRRSRLQRYPETTSMFFGGIGIYSTIPDYITFLRHILQIHAGRDVPNAIFQRSTVQSIFEPRMGPVGAALLDQVSGGFMGNPHYKNLNWGLGPAVTTADWEGRRKKGSGFWSGWAATFYFIDPTTGIALMAGSQIIPPMDKVMEKVADRLEEIVYANLEE